MASGERSTPDTALLDRILSAIEAEQRAPQIQGAGSSDLRFGLGVAHSIVRREWEAHHGKQS